MARTARQTKPAQIDTATQVQPTGTPAPDWSEKDIATTAQHLSEARDVRSQLLRELNAGKDRHADIDAMDAEIAAHEKKLGRLNDAKALRDAQNTAEARAARYEQTRVKLKTALD